MNENNREPFVIDEGINYIPRWIKQISDMEYGSVVTHENYNEKLNLNTAQGDYNTEVLRLLFTDANPTHVPHIKYLDNIIETEVNRIDNEIDVFKEDVDNRFTAVNERVDTVERNINGLQDQISANAQNISDILNGIKTVGKATVAEKIEGVDNIGAHRYYGTNYSGEVGFHLLPDAIYIEDMQGETFEIDGIYYTPRENSISESMLDESLRTKINREAITSYDQLLNRPSINSVLLTGNKTASDLGLQPAGNYLTEIPSEYVTDTELSSALNSYLTTSTASTTYATIANLNSLSNTVSGLSTTVTNNKTDADNKFARVFITSVPSGVTPKTGDLLITL